MKTRSLLAAGLLASGGCYDGVDNSPAFTFGSDGASSTDGNPTTLGGGSTGVSPTSSASGPDDGGVTGTGEPGDESTSTGAPPTEPEENTLARGIALSRVEANQGVAVTLNDGSTLVPVGGRNAELVYGRTTLVRAFWETGADWQPRAIEARLTLVPPNGEPEVLTEVRTVDGPPDERDLAGTFSWVLAPEDVPPGVQFSLGLHEVDETLFDDPPAPEPPRLPREGVSDLGVSPDEMVLKVVAIPVVNQSGGVIVTDANRKHFEDSMLAAYPVQSVEVTFRDPVNTGGILQQQQEGWDILRSARTQDGAAPNVYYHLLIDGDSCCADNGQFGWGGIAGVSSDDMNAASWGGRDAMSKVDGDGSWSLGVVIHELGHNHGRPHAPCGGPAGPDPNYPSGGDYAQAGIGVQGFDIVTGELYNPFPSDPPQNQWDNPLKDVMSYCWPSWWSDYNWQLNLERTRTLTSWDGASVDQGPMTWALRGILTSDGSQGWQVVRVPAAAASARGEVSAHLRFGSTDTETPAFVTELSEGGVIVGVPLPDGELNFDRVELEFPSRTWSVSVDDISREW